MPPRTIRASVGDDNLANHALMVHATIIVGASVRKGAAKGRASHNITAAATIHHGHERDGVGIRIGIGPRDRGADRHLNYGITKRVMVGHGNLRHANGRGALGRHPPITAAHHTPPMPPLALMPLYPVVLEADCIPNQPCPLAANATPVTPNANIKASAPVTIGSGKSQG